MLRVMVANTSRRGSWNWFLAGYTALVGFFVLEVATRSTGTASSLDASGDDQGTTDAIAAAYMISAAAAPVLRLMPLARLPGSAGQIGLITELAGLGVRAWSMRTLGRAYTRTLRTEPEQRVVEAGPYRYVRHPGYLGSNLIWLGFALTSGSPLVVAVVGVLVGDAYRRRIQAEEALLRRELPGYVEYSGRTRRLVPFVW
jgi:protein-S-isoprenylcysteine O-methyltransferase Ste14